ncbi:YggT family protein [Rhizobium sp. BK049]|nr:YggT family protein [Rhizobium sp. BK049]
MRFDMALARLVANVYMSVNNQLETTMFALFQTIDLVLNIYTWILIASAVFSWLYAFNVINSSNQFVNSVGMFLYNVTEPALKPIRRLLPNLGGIDISPIILLVIIFFLRTFLWTTLYPLVA